jgi:hypothetical protein
MSHHSTVLRTWAIAAAEKFPDPFPANWFSNLIEAGGGKPSKAVYKIDEILPKLTRAEFIEFLQWELIDELATAAPEARRRRLSTMTVCPCCEHWLGHNQPPANVDVGDTEATPYRRQSSFDFDAGRFR